MTTDTTDTTDPRIAALATALAEALVARDEALIERDAYCSALRAARSQEMAELAEARAELARLRDASPAAKATALMPDGGRFSRTDADLVEHAVRYARAPGHVRWSTVGARFGLGSTSAYALCLAVGVDPDERTPWGEVCLTCGCDLRDGGEE